MPLAVLEHGEEALVELPGAAHLAVDGRHRAEQQQRLVDEVAAEVAQDAAARGGYRLVGRVALEGATRTA